MRLSFISKKRPGQEYFSALDTHQIKYRYVLALYCTIHNAIWLDHLLVFEDGVEDDRAIDLAFNKSLGRDKGSSFASLLFRLSRQHLDA